MRLTAFILLCIGVQIMWNGIDALTGNAVLNGIPVELTAVRSSDPVAA